MLDLFEAYVALISQKGLHFSIDLARSFLIFEVKNSLEDGSARMGLLGEDTFLQVREVIICEGDGCFVAIFIITFLVSIGFDVDQFDGLVFLLQPTWPQ